MIRQHLSHLKSLKIIHCDGFDFNAVCKLILGQAFFLTKLLQIARDIDVHIQPHFSKIISVNILKKREYLGQTVNFKTRKHFAEGPAANSGNMRNG